MRVREPNDNENWEHINGDFIALQSELNNTIITSAILKTLRNCCRSNELAEIYSCKVVTAVFYKKSDQKNEEEFIDILEKEQENGKELYSYDFTIQGTKDLRPRIWTGIELKDLFVPLIDLRQKKKELIKQNINTLENQGKQKLIKNLQIPTNT